jgi:CheY-like chemotaxis protein
MAKLRVLVAEGNPGNQKMIQDVIKAFNVEVDVVSTSPETVKTARIYDFSLILVNLDIPDMLSGIKRMRAELNEAPMVVFSASATPEAPEQAKEAGANEFIPRAMTEDEVKRLVNRWVIRGDSWLG